MITAPKLQVVYRIDGEEHAAEVLPPVDTLPPSLLDYLRERRRAIITELRKIEDMLGMEQSIEPRKRPH